MIASPNRSRTARSPLAGCLLVVVLAIAGCASVPSDAELEGRSFKAFSQLETLGWRGLAAKRRYAEAAETIHRYLEINLDRLEPWQAQILKFHEAQMLACAGRREAALEMLPAGRIIPQPRSMPVDWNAMVDATEAFLRNDRAALLAAQSRIDARGDSPANRVEKARVRQLVLEFGRPYRRAWMPDPGLVASDLREEADESGSVEEASTEPVP